MHYKNTTKRIDEIGRELGVQYLLEGSVRRAAGRVRITAQLIQVSDQTHLWAESYERDLADVFAVQNDVAGRIAESLALKLLPEQEARLASSRPVNPEAYEAYLHGRHHLNRGTEEGFRKAVDYFKEVIALDPGCALAYAGMSDAYLDLDEWRFLPMLRQALEAATKALEIDDTLGEAYSSRARARLYLDWDWSRAESDFKRALELSPGYGRAHGDYAFFLSAMGRHTEAVAEGKLALEIDPLSASVHSTLGILLYYARRPDEAIEYCRKGIELYPEHFDLHVHLGMALAEKGRFEEAITELQRAMTLSPGSKHALEKLGIVYAVAVGALGRLLAGEDEEGLHTGVAPPARLAFRHVLLMLRRPDDPVSSLGLRARLPCRLRCTHGAVGLCGRP